MCGYVCVRACVRVCVDARDVCEMQSLPAVHSPSALGCWAGATEEKEAAKSLVALRVCGVRSIPGAGEAGRLENGGPNGPASYKRLSLPGVRAPSEKFSVLASRSAVLGNTIPHSVLQRLCHGRVASTSTTSSSAIEMMRLQ